MNRLAPPNADPSKIDPRTARIRGPGNKPLHFPRRLYKFMEREWADKLLDAGAFQIGTLHDYRNAEKHAHRVLDREEGTLTHREHIDEATDISKLSTYTHAAFVDPRGYEGATFSGMTLQAKFDQPNSYIYCTSLEPDWQSEIDPKYDRCIEIIHVHAFMLALGIELGRAGLADQAAFNAVCYKGRDHDTFTSAGNRTGGPPAPPEFLKPESYASQMEYRAVFKPMTATVETFRSSSLLVARSCFLHSKRQP